MMNDTNTRFEEELRRDLRQLADRAGQGPTSERVLERLRSRLPGRVMSAANARFKGLAAAVVIAAVIGSLLVWLTLGRGGAGIAWADVRDQILNAQTATWNVRVEMKGQDPVTYRVFSKEPGLMRQEMPGGLVVIVDVSKGVGISLDSKRKTALVMDMKGFFSEAVAGKGPNLSLAWFKELVKGSHEELGEKEIDGIKVRGFRIRQGGISSGTSEMWVDPATGYIVRSDFETAEHAVRVTTTDFELNPPLDDALFSTEVPEGYEVETSGIDFGGAGEKDLVEGLRYLAKHNEGVFPKVLMDPFNMPSRRQVQEELAASGKKAMEADRLSRDLEKRIKRRKAEYEKAHDETNRIISQMEKTDDPQLKEGPEQISKKVTQTMKGDVEKRPTMNSQGQSEKGFPHGGSPEA